MIVGLQFSAAAIVQELKLPAGGAVVGANSITANALISRDPTDTITNWISPSGELRSETIIAYCYSYVSFILPFPAEVPQGESIYISMDGAGSVVLFIDQLVS